MSHVFSRKASGNKPLFNSDTLKMIESAGGLKAVVPILAHVLQKQKGLTTEEARAEALSMVLGTGSIEEASKKIRGDRALKVGGPPWATVAEAAQVFGISRRTIERWLKSGCTIALETGHVVTIPLRRLAKSAKARGSLVSLRQVQELIAARAKASTPGRTLPAKNYPVKQAQEKINLQTAKNIWRCRRAITLLCGVTDASMLRTIQNQISLQIRRRWKPVMLNRRKY